MNIVLWKVMRLCIAIRMSTPFTRLQTAGMSIFGYMSRQIIMIKEQITPKMEIYFEDL